MIRVVRRPLEMMAIPPTEVDPDHYTVRYKTKVWRVEKAMFLELYQLASVAEGESEL